MQQRQSERGIATGLVIGSLGGATLTGIIAGLLAAKPVKAATPDEKIDYLIEVLTTLVPVLAQVVESQTKLITAIEQWLAAQGISLPSDTTAARIISGDPIQIFDADVRQAGLLQTNKMVDCRAVTNRGHILIKIESSLDQAITVQVVGNILEGFDRATDIGLPINLAPTAETSTTLDDTQWQPWIGANIVIPLAPTLGRLTIWMIIQE